MKRIAMLLALPAALAGCYVVPTADGQHAVFIPVGPSQGPGAMPVAPAQPALPRVLNARLYPANDLAAASGMVSGTVTNMGTGKGRFQLQYGNELLTGEATRVSGDQRKGVASAYGPTGAFMSCEYQMNSPQQGAGKCNFSNGAQYEVHIGN
jgi:hypothetical protein